VWAGVDNAWEQEKLEARKMLENAAESHTSGARFVGTLLDCKTRRFFRLKQKCFICDWCCLMVLNNSMNEWL